MKSPFRTWMQMAIAVLAGIGLWHVIQAMPSTSASVATTNDDALLKALLESEQIDVTPPEQSTQAEETTLSLSRQRPNQVSQVRQQPNVRVALFKQYPIRHLQVEADGRCHSVTGELQRVIDLSRINTAGLVCRGKEGGSIAVNHSPYQGSIELVRHAGEWLAINQLPMEAYVASVVGAEMPSHWNEEALKAQAVAARSYALVHVMRPASDHYHLGDSTRWQVYAGVASTSGPSRFATDATEGQVLQFRGGLVESLYAASAQISAEAHGHLGASMSQTGAQAMAEQGRTYTQILDRYYNGASLARIQLDGE